MGSFFIAIGGTGQMAALGYLRLAKLCGFKPAKMYLMDRDDSGPLSETLKNVLGQKSIPTISPLTQDENITRFDTIFGNPPKDDVSTILSLLFSDEQLSTSVKFGMYGRPPVGATALMSKIHQVREGYEEDQALQDLITLLKQTEGQRIVISGSVMGGTGAGGVPTLANYIKNSVVQKDVKLTIVDFLKWFAIQDEQTEMQLDKNVQSGVFYLKDKIAKNVDACVLLGSDQPSVTNVPYQEIGQQEEVKNFINLLAAVVITNSFHIYDYKTLFGTPNEIYAYAVPNQGTSPSKITVHLPQSQNSGKKNSVTVEQVVKMARAVSKFLGIFANYLSGGPDVFKWSFAPGAAIPGKLKMAFKTLAERETKNKTDLWEQASKAILQRKDDLDESITWFDALKLQDYFIFDTDQTTITSKKYERTINAQLPMAFLREWMHTANTNNWKARIEKKGIEGFVDEVVLSLRKILNKRYFNNEFGEMKWLDVDDIHD